MPRQQIIAAADSLAQRPFLVTLPHSKILYQPIDLPPEQQREWDEYMLKLAHENTTAKLRFKRANHPAPIRFYILCREGHLYLICAVRR